MNKNYENLEKIAEKKFAEKDKRKSPKMTVSGKSVLKLQELLIKKNYDRIPERFRPKKNK